MYRQWIYNEDGEPLGYDTVYDDEPEYDMDDECFDSWDEGHI